VVYERVTGRRRVRLHQRIGEREEAAYGERAGEIAAELAVHFERGRDYRRAVRYLGQAGERALRRSAYQEAITHLAKGLELLNTLPDTPERTHQELTLQIALGVSLMALKGWAAPEIGKTYARALELSRQHGSPAQQFQALFGLWVFSYTRAELHTARERADQLLELAHSLPDTALHMEAHHVVGNTLHRLGDLVEARTHLERGLALYDQPAHHSHVFQYGMDDRVTGLGYMAWVLWVLGYPDQAGQKNGEMLSWAQELAQPLCLAWALNATAWHHLFRRENHAAHERAEEQIALCGKYGFAQLAALGTIVRGWALASQDHAPEGIVQLQQGLAAVHRTGAAIGRPRYLALLAEAYGKVGQEAEGLSLLTDALETIHTTAERFWAAEVYRLKGVLTLQSKTSPRQVVSKAKASPDKSVNINAQPLTPSTQAEADAEAYFHKAIEIARRQSAKSFELRAVLSLSRLWQRQGKKKKARQMLAEIYSWFTEGFDTKDLQEAKVLLDESA